MGNFNLTDDRKRIEWIEETLKELVSAYDAYNQKLGFVPYGKDMLRDKLSDLIFELTIARNHLTQYDEIIF